VVNKVDLLAEDDLEVAREMLLGEIDWDGPVFLVSAETGEGTDELGQAIMRELEEMDQVEAGSVDP
jgi:GTP-binding protein